MATIPERTKRKYTRRITPTEINVPAGEVIPNISTRVDPVAAQVQRDVHLHGLSQPQSRRPRQPKAPEAPRLPLAMAEIDQRLVAAMRQLPEVNENLSALAYWQDKANRIDQEIQRLIDLCKQLTGQPLQTNITGIPFGISSIPAPVAPRPVRQVQGEVNMASVSDDERALI
jgi:hypothetical protein